MKHSALFTATIAAAAGICMLRAQGTSSTRDGVYTDAQAERGQAAYKASCASCHGETLGGSGAQSPALTGQDFLTNWTGEDLDQLFEKIQTSMPADHPGSLSRTVNAGILAYLLKANKLPAGTHELPSDPGALKQIQFEAAK